MRLLIAEDDKALGQFLSRGLEADGHRVHLAYDGGAAVEAFRQELPDLTILDLNMPVKDGEQVLKEVRTLDANLPVLVLSMHDEALYVERVLRAGGRGYIMKEEGGKKIAQAIRQVLDGQIYVSEKMSAKILEIFSGHGADAAASPVEKLTDREFEVFQLMGQGLESKPMAEKLRLSPRTIEVHRAHIKAKLNLNSMAELIGYAVRWVESQNTGV